MCSKKKFFLAVAKKFYRFPVFFPYREKNTDSFFTPDTHESTDSEGGSRIILTYEGVDKIERERDRERGGREGRKRMRDRMEGREERGWGE